MHPDLTGKKSKGCTQTWEGWIEREREIFRVKERQRNLELRRENES